MDLDKIIICDRKARIAKSTIELLEQLPLEVPNQRNCWVQAYRDSASPETIDLDFLYETREVADNVTLLLPREATDVKKGEV